MTALRIDPRDGEGGVGTGGVTLSTGNSNKDDGGPGALDLTAYCFLLLRPVCLRFTVNPEHGGREEGMKKMRVMTDEV